MNAKINKGMILAAGLGTRLRPLTLDKPKPLLPIGEFTLLDNQIFYLKKFGISEVIMNLHHLGYAIKDYAGDGSKYGISIEYSEEPEILGTGGGIRNAMDFFDDDPFVVLNCDSVLEVNIDALVNFHMRDQSKATMAVKKLSEGQTYTPVDMSDGKICGFGSGKHLYTGLQILTKDFLKLMPEARTPYCLIRDGYEKAIAMGMNVSAFEYKGYWNDVGTHESYERLRMDIVSGRFKPFFPKV